MMFNTAESLLIVEAGNTGKFSKLLYNMIGKNDDTEAGPTGPVDGSVDASIFNEDSSLRPPSRRARRSSSSAGRKAPETTSTRFGSTTPKLSTRKASTSA